MGVNESSAATFDGFWIMNGSGATLGTFNVDDIELIARSSPLPTATPRSPVSVAIDLTQERKNINPDIYGVSYGTEAVLKDLNITANRMGGNNASRYNWRDNADNRGSDWYFETFQDSEGAVPGGRFTSFIQSTKNAGAKPMLTIPLLDWVGKVGPNGSILGSFPVSKYGAQTAVDPYRNNAGNGIRLSDNKPITGNDPNDANVRSDATFQRGLVEIARNAFLPGQTHYYILDNEPGLWNGTHRDVHPTPSTIDEIVSKSLAYAKMIKEVDPEGKVVGMEEWGWTNFSLSASDVQYASAHNWTPPFPDQQAHGGLWISQYYLKAVQRGK